mmetsp:Transcript_7967/g.21542  ORF Transcript_7967/g.21542 Transcript_7967/m.21542 type:complete len:153 (-) Transcript_7967:4-462(-)
MAVNKATAMHGWSSHDRAAYDQHPTTAQHVTSMQSQVQSSKSMGSRAGNVADQPQPVATQYNSNNKSIFHGTTGRSMVEQSRCISISFLVFSLSVRLKGGAEHRDNRLEVILLRTIHHTCTECIPHALPQLKTNSNDISAIMGCDAVPRSGR